ncbi:hypothetical protein M513_13793 [Trichuris suis]|uniref:Uncharacterized protein n=1 Tax=Trichuris suis TaxID=68888 RepID=A0A085LK34_9BILA|nr:hypothetical protein M513_13793 [Trichuris suis]
MLFYRCGSCAMISSLHIVERYACLGESGRGSRVVGGAKHWRTVDANEAEYFVICQDLHVYLDASITKNDV